MELAQDICRKGLDDRVRERVRVCPVCGSSDLYWEAGMIAGQLYHCRNCDYVGALVVEKERDAEDD